MLAMLFHPGHAMPAGHFHAGDFGAFALLALGGVLVTLFLLKE